MTDFNLTPRLQTWLKKMHRHGIQDHELVDRFTSDELVSALRTARTFRDTSKQDMEKCAREFNAVSSCIESLTSLTHNTAFDFGGMPETAEVQDLRRRRKKLRRTWAQLQRRYVQLDKICIHLQAQSQARLAEQTKTETVRDTAETSEDTGLIHLLNLFAEIGKAAFLQLVMEADHKAALRGHSPGQRCHRLYRGLWHCPHTATLLRRRRSKSTIALREWAKKVLARRYNPWEGWVVSDGKLVCSGAFFLMPCEEGWIFYGRCPWAGTRSETTWGCTPRLALEKFRDDSLGYDPYRMMWCKVDSLPPVPWKLADAVRAQAFTKGGA